MSYVKCVISQQFVTNIFHFGCYQLNLSCSLLIVARKLKQQSVLWFSMADWETPNRKMKKKKKSHWNESKIIGTLAIFNVLEYHVANF